MHSLIVPLMLAAAGIGRADIPVDKSYEQLTPEQKRLVRSNYGPMGRYDEPPFPLRGLKQLILSAEEGANRARAAGELDIRVVVGPDGKAHSARIYKAPDREMGRALAALMLSEAYKPGRCAGRPCAQEFRLHLRFRPK